MRHKSIFSLLFLLFLPFYLLPQNVIIERIENCPNNIPIDPGKVSFLYFLEEGKQSPYLEWAEDYKIPADSLQSWSCRYRSFKNSGFLENEGTVYVKFAENDAGHDSIYIDRMYVEITAENTFDVKFAFRMVLFGDQIVRISCSDPAPLDLAVLTLKFQYRKSLSRKNEMPPLPPPPPFDVDEQELERHKRAIKELECQGNNPTFPYKITYKSRLHPIEITYGKPFSIPFPGPDKEEQYMVNLIDEMHGTALTLQLERDPGRDLVSDVLFGESLVEEVLIANQNNTFLGEDSVENVGGLTFKRFRFRVNSGKWGPRIQEILIYRNQGFFLNLIRFYKEEGPYQLQLMELEQGLKLAFP